MNSISTLTQKGQVAIPKSIRDHFSLKPFDKLHFSVEDNKIIAQPVLDTSTMRGFIKTTKTLSRAEMRKIVQKEVMRKYANRS